jgi:hypothetical protein
MRQISRRFLASRSRGGRWGSRLVALIAIPAAFVAFANPAAAAPPDSSGVVERLVIPDITLFADVDEGFAVFVNISRDDFCDSGEPQEDWNFHVVDSPPGALLVHRQAQDVPIYLYPFNEDVPPLVGPCEDTQEEPAFVGTADVTLTDNDVFVSGGRTDSFGEAGRGIVYATDDGSAWHYSWTNRLLIDRDGVFTVATENSNLHPVGN